MARHWAIGPGRGVSEQFPFPGHRTMAIVWKEEFKARASYYDRKRAEYIASIVPSPAAKFNEGSFK